MPGLSFVFVGKMRERHYAEAFEEYFKRLGAFGKPELREIAEERLPEQPSEKEIARALEREAAEIEKAVPKGACVVALCVEARSLSSPALAERLARIEAGGARRLVFVLGGSNGLSPALLARANERLSFSPMTFPHQLARVMLLEQLYRCRKILAHEAYHK